VGDGLISRYAGAHRRASRSQTEAIPVAYAMVRTLLRDLHDAGAEILWLRSDRDRWQEAYCEARLETRRREASP
jgi:hypothetical protein